jgi:dTDP-4-dehydrorhamnose reductase
VIITGATGTLGRAFGLICGERGLSAISLSRQELDIADLAAVDAVISAYRPWAVINAAGYVRVDDAENERESCQRANVTGPTILATVTAARGVKLVTFSSDLVFDGDAGRPYLEADPVAPLNVYGATKAEAERAVLGRCPDALVVRTSALFGPWDEANFVAGTLRTLRVGNVFAAAEDITVSPSYVPDVVNATLDLLIDGVSGLWHLASPDPVSWAELARAVARGAGYDLSLVEGRSASTFGWPARRPAYTPLATRRGAALAPLEECLARLLQVWRVSAAAWTGCAEFIIMSEWGYHSRQNGAGSQIWQSAEKRYCPTDTLRFMILFS